MPAVNQAQRGAMRPLARHNRARAYFAPVDRLTGTPTIFDPAATPGFDLDAPPAPWIDAGWVLNLERKSGTAIATLATGPRGLAQKQFRHGTGAGVAFDFLDWGKLQMAISAGCQQMNLLEEEPSVPPRASGGAARLATAVFSGSTATSIRVGAGAVSTFEPGDIVVVDVDYQQQTGYIGDIAGAYVANPADVGFDVDYVRRVSFRVSRVADKTADHLILAQPLIGSVPQGASLQKVVGFVDREGGRFFPEWSALFVIESETGARIFYHYPRLQPAAPAAESSREVAAFSAWSLHARLAALPVTDPNDAQQVLCFRTLVPAPHAAVY